MGSDLDNGVNGDLDSDVDSDLDNGVNGDLDSGMDSGVQVYVIGRRLQTESNEGTPRSDRTKDHLDEFEQ